MRISILSIFLALVVAVAGPLAFAEPEAAQDQVTEQETAPSAEALTESSDTSVEVVEAKEDCTNGADDDGDEKIDCEDADCAGDPGCTSGN